MGGRKQYCADEGEADVPFLIDWVKPKGTHSSVVVADNTTTARDTDSVDSVGDILL